MLPVFLNIHRHTKQKEFFKCYLLGTCGICHQMAVACCSYIRAKPHTKENFYAKRTPAYITLKYCYYLPQEKNVHKYIRGFQLHNCVYQSSLNFVNLMGLRSREYRFTHMNCSTVDIPFLLEALSSKEGLVIATGGEEEEEEGEKVDLKFA